MAIEVQELIDSIDGIVWEVDVPTFRFTFVSQQAERLLGYPLSEWHEVGFWQSVLHPDDREWAVDFCLSQTRAMKAHVFEYRVLARDGRVVWLRDLVSVVVSEGAPVSLRGIMIDVTDLKTAQADRDRLLQEAQAALRLRDEFMSIASHELRTPVTSLRLAVQGLSSGLVPVSPETLSRTLRLLERQTDRLTQLINDLLDVSRIQSGRLPLLLEDVDLCLVVGDIAEQFRGDLTRAHCQAEVHAERPVRGRWDRQRLEQVVSNLLSNAIKFAPGTRIELAVTESEGVARLTVEDHGIGIDPERLPHLFQRYERAVPARSYGGLGLGLFITRSIVEALGGAVRVQSTLGEGSTFTVELPCRVEPTR